MKYQLTIMGPTINTETKKSSINFRTEALSSTSMSSLLMLNMNLNNLLCSLNQEIT